MRKGHHHPDQHWNCLKGKRDNLDQTNIAGIWRQQWENIWEAWWSTCGLSRAHHYNLKVNRTVPHNNWHIKMAHSHTAADLSLQTPFELPGQQWSSTPPGPSQGFQHHLGDKPALNAGEAANEAFSPWHSSESGLCSASDTLSVQTAHTRLCAVGSHTFHPKPLYLEWPKLQTLVYILPSTTAVFSYVTGSRKLSANKQFFIGAQTVVSLLQTVQIKQGVSFIATNKVYTRTNKTAIIWIETELLFFLLLFFTRGGCVLCLCGC